MKKKSGVGQNFVFFMSFHKDGLLGNRAHYWRSENKLARKPIGLFLSIVYHTSPLL